MFSFLKRRRSPKQRIERTVRFVGEQDGPIERRLKADLLTVLNARPNIKSAYLARVAYDNNPKAQEVALALRSVSGDDRDLVPQVGECFARYFRRDVHMDILFLSDHQETEVGAVCAPFYKHAR